MQPLVAADKPLQEDRPSVEKGQGLSGIVLKFAGPGRGR